MGEALSKIMTDHGAMAVVLAFVGICVVWGAKRLLGARHGILTNVGTRAVGYFDKLEERDERQQDLCGRHAECLQCQVVATQKVSECLESLTKSQDDLLRVHGDSDAPFATRTAEKMIADLAEAEIMKIESDSTIDEGERRALIRIYTRVKNRAERRMKEDSEEANE